MDLINGQFFGPYKRIFFDHLNAQQTPRSLPQKGFVIPATLLYKVLLDGVRFLAKRNFFKVLGQNSGRLTVFRPLLRALKFCQKYIFFSQRNRV